MIDRRIRERIEKNSLGGVVIVAYLENGSLNVTGRQLTEIEWPFLKFDGLTIHFERIRQIITCDGLTVYDSVKMAIS